MAKNVKKNQHRWAQDNNVSNSNSSNNSDKFIELEGQVIEAMPSTLFQVLTKEGATVLCTLAGKVRQNRIRVLPGDQVKIEVGLYDLTRGRIVWRR